MVIPIRVADIEVDQHVVDEIFDVEQVEILRDTGQYPGQARVLAGQVYYLMGDLDSAMIEVEQLSKTFHVHKKDPGLLGSVRSLFRRERIANALDRV